MATSNRLHLTALLTLPLTLAAADCDQGNKDTTPPGDTAEYVCDPVQVDIPTESSERAGYGCVAEFTYDPLCADPVRGVRVSGDETTPAGDPGEVEIASPEDCDFAAIGRSYYVFDPTTSDANSIWHADVADHSFCDVGEDSSVLSCNSDVQAQSGTWQVFLPAPTPPLTCEDYGEVTFEFLFDGAEDCGGNSTTTYVASGDCTPAQDVPIEFFHWSVRDNDGTGTEHSFIVPVVESGGDFSARAWLREITVSDFNDADELYIVPRGERVQFTSGDTIDGSNLLKLDANNTSDTYSVGEVEMGAAFLVDGVPRGPGPFVLPEVTVDWSCQYNPFNPHFTVIPNLPQAYAARLGDLGLYGVDQDHRIILRNFPSVDLATVELEGRSERFLIPMTESQGVYYFDRTTESHGVIDIAGSATLVGDDVVVSLSTFKLSETNLGTRVFTFEPLDE